ncbi:exosporium glycoprotein BclB-related protein [Spirosoma sp.]|uniref:exosporium glycoprotein BclB-related protein n=1 Tax=Spirosoma sp. TaxID=1899569 RepID=UPI003B3BC3E2
MINVISFGLTFFLLLVVRVSMAQVGIGTTSPDPSAQLEIRSTSKGLLIPRVTSTTNVTATAEGLLVYQTTAPAGFYVYKSGSWMRLLTTEDSGGSSSGTIIPYASGMPVTMLTGPTRAASLPGFGNAASTVYIINGAIDLSGGGGNLLHFAFPAPRSGTITSIAGFFSSTATFTATTPVTITAQVYQATGSSSSFTPISGAVLTLTPTLSGTVSVNTTGAGLISGLSIPVTAGTRLLLVFTASTSGSTVIAVNGYVSGGVTIN